MFRKQDVIRNMPTPKRMTELRYWLKGAQTAIKEIPRTIAESSGMVGMHDGHDGWFVHTSDVDKDYIRFNLENRFGEKAQIVIKRRAGGSLGY